jgi:hypothetical protein
MVLPADVEELKNLALRSCVKIRGGSQGYSLGGLVGFTSNPNRYRAELHPRIRAVIDAVFEQDDSALIAAKSALTDDVKRLQTKINVTPFFATDADIQDLLGEIVYNVSRFTKHLRRMEAAEKAAVTSEPATLIDSATAEAQGRQSNLFGPSHPQISPFRPKGLRDRR